MKTKRLLSMVLALAMIFGMLPQITLPARAAGVPQTDVTVARYSNDGGETWIGPNSLQAAFVGVEGRSSDLSIIEIRKDIVLDRQMNMITLFSSNEGKAFTLRSSTENGATTRYSITRGYNGGSMFLVGEMVLENIIIDGGWDESTQTGYRCMTSAGGAVTITDNGKGYVYPKLIMRDKAVIRNNKVVGYNGGAVYGFRTYANGAIEVHMYGNASITNNRVDNGFFGGGIYLSNANSTVTYVYMNENSSVTGNYAGFGGGVYANLTYMYGSSSISGNTAEVNGGGIDGGCIMYGNTSVNNNTAGNFGGGIFKGNVGHSAVIMHDNAEVKGNRAKYVGGVNFYWGDNGVTANSINEWIVKDENRTGVQDAQLYAMHMFDNAKVIINTAEVNGGGIGGIVIMHDNSSVTGNVAETGGGGGIWDLAGYYHNNGSSAYPGGVLLLGNAKVSGNKALSGKGGGIYINRPVYNVGGYQTGVFLKGAPTVDGNQASEGNNIYLTNWNGFVTYGNLTGKKQSIGVYSHFNDIFGNPAYQEGGQFGRTPSTRYYGYDAIYNEEDRNLSAGYDVVDTTYLAWRKTEDSVTLIYNSDVDYARGVTASLPHETVRRGNYITVDPNGGRVADPRGDYITEATRIQLNSDDSFELYTPTRTDGATFIGWRKIEIMGDMILQAQWQGIDAGKIIIFNANGGTGNIDPISVPSGEEVTLPESTFGPPDESKEFAGWGTSASSGVWKIPGQTFTPTSDVTVIYAQWKNKVMRYNVRFVGNGASGSMDPITDVASGSNIQLPSNGFTIPKDHYFLEWNTKADGTGTGHQPGINFHVTGHTTLFAIWKHGFALTYDGNGATGGAMADQKINIGETLTLLNNGFTRENYMFIGWSTNKNASASAAYYDPDTNPDGILYNNRQSFSIAEVSRLFNKATTLYAIWDKTTYTISYNANGGSGTTMPNTEVQRTIPLKTMQLPACTYTRDGYVFIGWSTVSGTSAVNVELFPGGDFTPTKDTTLYAIWSNKNIVIFDKNSPDATGTMSNQTFDIGQRSPLNPNRFSLAGYEFAKWTTEPDGTGISYNDGQEITPVGVVRLYAQWTKTGYVITYDANAADATGSVAKTVVTFPFLGAAVNATVSDNAGPGFTREGYRFDGWNTKADGAGTNYQPNDTISLRGDITLYAKWKRVFIITFYPNGALSGGMQPVPVDEGEEVTLPVNGFVWDGHAFNGWATYAGGAVVYADKARVRPTSNLNLYAMWKNGFKVSFHGNGAEGYMAPVVVDAGSSLPLPDNGSNPPTDGFTPPAGKVFAGWGWISGEGVRYPVGYSYTPMEDVTLYAQWDNIPSENVTLNYADAATDENGDGVPDRVNVTYKSGTKLNLKPEGGTMSGSISGVVIDGTADKNNIELTESTNSVANPTRQYYVFKGWTAQETKTGDIVTAVTLTATWELEKYTVTFEGNGATGGSVAPITKERNQTVILPENADPGFTGPDGTVFAGWATWYTGGTLYQPGEEYGPLLGDVTLYARWTEKLPEKVSLSYAKYAANSDPSDVTEEYPYNIPATIDPDGGSISGTLCGVSITGKTPRMVNLTNDDTLGDAARDGWTFKGWELTETKESGKVTAIMLKAKWEPGKWNVYFEPNGAVGTGFSIEITRETELTFHDPAAGRPAGSNIFTAPANTQFKGWAVSASGTGDLYQAGDTYTPYKDGMTFYAIWADKLPEKVSLSYAKFGVDDNDDGVADVVTEEFPYNVEATIDPAGGTMNGMLCGTVISGNTSRTLNLTSNDVLNAPTREGYTFKGWKLETTEESGKVTAVTLEAQWEQNKYTVYFDSNGGEGIMAPEKVVPNGELLLPENGFTRNEWRFIGWSTMPNGGTIQQPNTSVTVSRDGTTFYAQWEPENVTLTYNAPDSNVDGELASTVKTYKHQTEVTLKPEGGALRGTILGTNISGTDVRIVTLTDDVEVLDPVRDHYIFRGWLAEETTDGAGNVTAVVLTATWQARKYTITFSNNGGSGEMAPQMIEYGVPTRLNANTFTRAGFVFSGWSTYASSGAVVYRDSDEITYPEGDMVLIAEWEVEYYTLEFNANGGSGEPERMQNLKADQTVTLDSTIPIHSDANNRPVVFIGWTKTVQRDILDRGDAGKLPQAPEKYYEAGTSYQMPETGLIGQTVTLHALWGYDANGNGVADVLENRYSLSYNVGGGTGAPEAQDDLLEGETIQLSDVIPTHTQVNGKNVIFIGWTTEQESTSKIYSKNETAADLPERYQAGESFVMPKEPGKDAVLYALWSYDENGTGGGDVLESRYSLTYDLNGGFDGPEAVDNLLVGETVSVSDVEPTHQGANNKAVVFLGWTETRMNVLAKDGTLPDKYYKAGDAYVMAAENRVLYALWAYDENGEGTGADILENKYVLRYNISGGNSATPPDMPNLLAKTTVILTSMVPTHADVASKKIEFIGWTTEAEAQTKIYGRGDTLPEYYATATQYEMPTDVPANDSTVITLYAVWSNGEVGEGKLTLAYHLNGGDGSVPETHTGLREGDEVTLSDLIPTHAAVNGKAVVFIGWSRTRLSSPLNKSAVLPEYNESGTEYTMPDKSVVLYAVWAYDENGLGGGDVLENKFTLVYEVNGGSSAAPTSEAGLLGGTTTNLTREVPKHANGEINGKTAPILFIGWTETADSEIYQKDGTLPEYFESGSKYGMPARAADADGEEVIVYALWGYDENDNGTVDVLERKYSIIYDANGGDTSSVPAEQTGVLAGSKAMLRDAEPSHAEENGKAIVFIGWTTEQNRTVYSRRSTLPTVYYKPGDEITMPARNLTLYALWGYDENGNDTGADVLENKYTLAYNVNGGNSTAPAKTRNLLAYETVSLSGTTPMHANANLDGKSTRVAFIGWTNAAISEIYKKDGDLSGVEHYGAGADYTMPSAAPATDGEDVTVYALWGYDENGNGMADILEEKYELSFNANTGDESSVPAAMPEVLAGSLVTLPSDIPTHADEDGKAVVFIGWTTEPVQKIFGKEDRAVDLPENKKPGTTYTMPAGDTELYALWGYDENGSGTGPDVLEKKYKLIYNVNGGIGSTAPAQEINLLAYADVNLTMVEPKCGDVSGKPVAFIGWMAERYTSKIFSRSDAANALPEYYEPGEAYTMSAKDATVFALWGYDENNNGTADVLEDKYTVTYTDGGEGIFADQVSSGLLIGETTPAFNGSTEREGYSFIGWAPELSRTVEGTVTYTAQWEIITYTIRFSGNGAEGSMADATVNYGDEFEVPGNGFTVPEGKSFEGWNTKADGSGTTYQPEAKFTPEADVTLYAIWKNGVLDISFVRENDQDTELDVIKILRWVEMSHANTGEPYTDGYDSRMISDTVFVKAETELLAGSEDNLALVKEMLANATYQRYYIDGFAKAEVEMDVAKGVAIVSFRGGDCLRIEVDVSNGNIVLNFTSLSSAVIKITFNENSENKYEFMVVTPGDVNFDGLMNAVDWTNIMRWTLNAKNDTDTAPEDFNDITVNGNTYNIWVLVADMTGLTVKVVESEWKSCVNAVDWTTIMKLLLQAWKN